MFHLDTREYIRIAKKLAKKDMLQQKYVKIHNTTSEIFYDHY